MRWMPLLSKKMKRLNQKSVKNLIYNELHSYQHEYDSHNFNLAFRHLERIHIVSQPYPIEHTIIHLRMLLFAIRTFRPFEILVQLAYSLFSFKFSALNIFPQGNTGGANAIKKGRMPIPTDLKKIILEGEWSRLPFFYPIPIPTDCIT